MATNLRRNVNSSSDNMNKFLFYVLRQLDLRSIDWAIVAKDMGITNGHAARMRYSRFKAQMEGTYSTARKPARESAESSTGSKTKGPKSPAERRAKKMDTRRKAAGKAANGKAMVKAEEGDGEPYVKEEDADNEDEEDEEEGIKAEPLEADDGNFRQFAVWG